MLKCLILLNKPIKVFRYNNCPSVDIICNELAKRNIESMEYQDKEKPGKTIELETKFELGDRIQGGISGTIDQQYQQKIANSKTERYSLITIDMEFFIDPNHEIIILRGAPVGRSKVKKMIEKILSDEDRDIKNIRIEKDEQMELVDYILKEDLDNRIQGVTFRINRKKTDQGIKNRILKMHADRCVRGTKEFKEVYKKADSFDCKLSLIKCDELINKTTVTPAKLSIRNDTSFSFNKDIELKQWSGFVLERCLKILD